MYKFLVKVFFHMKSFLYYPIEIEHSEASYTT